VSAAPRSAVERVVAQIEALILERRSRSMAWWRECDLSIPQLHVLVTLNERGATTVGALADALSISAPSASSIVDRLVERDAVVRVRSTEDRRQVLVSLSDQGRRFADEMHGLGRATLTGVLEQLDDDDLDELLRLLDVLAVAARRVGAGASAAAAALHL